MKKIFVIMLLLSIVFVFSACGTIKETKKESENNKSQTQIKSFDLNDYSEQIENYASSENVGKISDAETAIRKAKELWNDKSFNTYIDLDGEMKFTALYDSKNDCWYVSGDIPTTKNEDGSVEVTLCSIPHAIIREDGNVLAVWLDLEG